MGTPASDPLMQGLADLYDQFGPALFRVACVLLPSRADAEDAVQEVFTGLVRSQRRLAGVKNLRAYLFAALRSACGRIAAARKKEWRVEQDLALLPAPGPSGLEPEQALRLERGLRQLPAEQRELVALKVDGGLTFAEIAACLGISPNTAASRYRYALEKLRAALEDPRDEPSAAPR